MMRVLVGPLFVLLWSTGFIGAKYGLPYAEPLTFLAIRFIIVVALLLAFAMLVRAAWPPRRSIGRIAGIGVLLHGFYLGGVFVAIGLGLGAGPASLITSVSPIAAAAISRGRFGERLTAKQIVGMSLGLLGVALVVGERLEARFEDWPAICLCVIAMLGMGLGAVEQRALSESAVERPPMATSNLIQYAAALAVVGAGAAMFETREVRWTPEFAFAVGWLVLVLSIGAVSLLYILLRRGAASEATSLVFLTPAVTAAMAWAMFGETLGAIQVAGFAIGCVGVGLVTKKL